MNSNLVVLIIIKPIFSIDETRTTMPAWKLRDVERSRYDYVHSNPQEHIFTPFKHNLNTRILEKDYYTKNKNNLYYNDRSSYCYRIIRKCLFSI